MKNLTSQLSQAKDQYSSLIASLNVFASKGENDSICNDIDNLLLKIERLERTIEVRSEARKLRLRVEV